MRVLSIRCDKCKEECKARHGESVPAVLTISLRSGAALDLCTTCAKLFAEFFGIEVHTLYQGS